MNTREVLLAAADLIEERGLHKGSYIDWDGVDGTVEPLVQGLVPAPGWHLHTDAPCCAAGAILGVSPSLLEGRMVTIALSMFVGNVPTWNDHPLRTTEEVVATLREVANSVH